MPENEETTGQIPEAAITDFADPAPCAIQPAPDPTEVNAPRRGIAPLWHTAVLVLAILAFSLWGALRPDSSTINPLAPVQRPLHAASADGSDPLRIIRYGLTGGLELIVVAWVALGLRLRKTPFRSLFGAWPSGLNDVTKEVGIAALFWICSMVVLGSVAFTWNLVETRIDNFQTARQQREKPQPLATSKSPSASQSPSGSKAVTPKHVSPEQKQADTIRELMELAPNNGKEIAAWALLCLIVGFSEELIFRGYLQMQSIALLHRVPLSIALTALIFGAAHGYQGIRGIVLITVYGILFAGITLLRKSLMPGMLAHGWHDFATGMALAILRATHVLDHFPFPQ
jgi:hypothetical protein